MPLRQDALPRSRSLFRPLGPLLSLVRSETASLLRRQRPKPTAPWLVLVAVLAGPAVASRWVVAAEVIAQTGGLATPSAPLLPAPPAPQPAQVPSPATTPAAPEGAAGLVTIESDSQRADNRTGIVTATGNVRIRYPARGLVATARQAQYFTREARLVLSGDVTVIDAEGQRIQAERLIYQLDSERLQAQPASGRQVVTRLRLQAPPGGQPPSPLLP